MLQALEPVHADVICLARLRSRLNNRRKARLLDPSQAQINQLADPITNIVQEHQPDQERNGNQVKEANPADGGWLSAAARQFMHGSQGKTCSGPGMALATSLGQVLGIDGGARIRRRKDQMDPVTTGAIRRGLGACLDCKPVERGIIAEKPVRRDVKSAVQPDVPMTLPAGLRNMRRGNSRTGICRRLDIMRSVARRADGSLVDTALDGLAMDTLIVVLRDLCVAGATQLRDGLLEGPGVRSLQLVGITMANLAGRRSLVSAGVCHPMHAVRPLTCLLRMALGALGQNYTLGVGEGLNPGMAGGAA